MINIHFFYFYFINCLFVYMSSYLLFTNMICLFENLQKIRKKRAKEILFVEILSFGYDFILNVFVVLIIICLLIICLIFKQVY